MAGEQALPRGAERKQARHRGARRNQRVIAEA